MFAGRRRPGGGPVVSLVTTVSIGGKQTFNAEGVLVREDYGYVTEGEGFDVPFGGINQEPIPGAILEGTTDGYDYAAGNVFTWGVKFSSADLSLVTKYKKVITNTNGVIKTYAANWSVSTSFASFSITNPAIDWKNATSATIQFST